jgi:hypothetical protein
MSQSMHFLRIAGLYTALGLAASVIAPAMASSAETKNADILGTWTLTRVLDSAEITAMDAADAAKLVGKTLEIRTGGIIFAGEPCQNHNLERRREPTAKYIREAYHAPAGRLGLPATVTVVHLTCTEALLKSKSSIVVFWDGFFFDAVKSKAATH